MSEFRCRPGDPAPGVSLAGLRRQAWSRPASHDLQRLRHDAPVVQHPRCPPAPPQGDHQFRRHEFLRPLIVRPTMATTVVSIRAAALRRSRWIRFGHRLPDQQVPKFARVAETGINLVEALTARYNPALHPPGGWCRHRGSFGLARCRLPSLAASCQPPASRVDRLPDAGTFILVRQPHPSTGKPMRKVIMVPQSATCLRLTR